MWIVCIDLESVLIPEIWEEIAKKLNVEELKLTTRDIPDFKLLMKKRIEILRKNKIRLKKLQNIVKKMKPLKGAFSFLTWLRENFPVIIISDTFFEFWKYISPKLNFPLALCNNYFEVDKNGFIKNYRRRKSNAKKLIVKKLNELGFKVIAIGDSFNDISMLKEANVGILFNPTKELNRRFFNLKKVKHYKELKENLKRILKYQ